MTTAQELVEVSKSFVTSDLLKFDKTTYDTARQALAQLIQIEAKEMENGSDEQMSIAHLLEAVHHLFAWYTGEEAEGEVEEMIEMAAKPKDEEKSEHMKKIMPNKGESLSEFKSRCKEAGMDDDYAKECYTKYMAANEDTEKSAMKKIMPNKGESLAEFKARCKEAGMDDDYAKECYSKYMAADKETDKSAEADEPAAEEATEETTENSPEPVSEESVEALVEQVVKSATESMKSEIASLLAATKAAEARAVTLESELATAKSAAVAGGPKRTGVTVGQSNDILSKAAAYKAKANATTDPVLAKGYKQLAEEYLAKASDSTLNK